LSFCVSYRLEPHMEVTYFLLTQDPLKYTMPDLHTNDTRLQYTAESILTELHCRRRSRKRT
jgi:hypothetical protein